MTTQIYECYTSLWKDTGSPCPRGLYIKNHTQFEEEWSTIQYELKYVHEILKDSGQWHGEQIVEIVTYEVDSSSPIPPWDWPLDWPKGMDLTQNYDRVGWRVSLTDMTLQEYLDAISAHMIAHDLGDQYQAYLTALDQMRNDPNIVWRMDWTLVSTTP